jgi:hypothetical protein
MSITNHEIFALYCLFNLGFSKGNKVFAEMMEPWP